VPRRDASSHSGGAGNETLQIALSDTDVELVGVVAKPARRRRPSGSVELRGMLALLMAVALVGLTALALQLAGAVVAIAAGVLVLNACLLVVLVRAHRHPPRAPVALPEQWRPSSFKRPPEAPAETELAPTVKIRRR
jgi:Flp pilus assembly protein TadB